MEPPALSATPPAGNSSGSGSPNVPAVPLEQLSFDLRVVSPSIPQPLSMTSIPASTTTKELKSKIRLQLPPQFSESTQRLIYRGRMLNRDDETLLNVFGEDLIRSSETAAVHLILSDSSERSTPVSMSPARGTSPAPSTASQQRAQAQQAALHNANQFRTTVQQTTRWRMSPTSQPAGQATLGPQGTPAVSMQAHTHHPGGQQYPRMSLSQAFNMQNQAAARLRFMNEMRNPVVQPGVTTPDGSQRRASPGPAQQGLSDIQVQNILRSADTRDAISTITGAMERSASGASLGPLSGRATPNPSSRTPSGGATANNGPITSGAPEVYILNSPQGPRALLYHRGPETYFYTPTPARPPRPPIGLPDPYMQPLFPMPTLPVGDTTAHRNVTQQGDQQNGQELRMRHVQAQEARDQPAAQAVPVRPADPGVAAQIARVWPHFWLALKLAVFVWWFTSPHSSWSRWLTVIAIAFAIFISNTGALDGVAEQLWRIICRQMENLIPLTDPNQARNMPHTHQAAQAAATAADSTGQAQPRAGMPEPAQVAQRLVQQRRRANTSWVTEQARRVKRASLLFLASIAPGVAEGHIAHLERAEAERQRLLAEAAAAEDARRAAAEEAEATAATANPKSTEQPGKESDGAGPSQEKQPEAETENAEVDSTS